MSKINKILKKSGDDMDIMTMEFFKKNGLEIIEKLEIVLLDNWEFIKSFDKNGDCYISNTIDSLTFRTIEEFKLMYKVFNNFKDIVIK